MTEIKLIVNGASAEAQVNGPLTAGMVGIPVTIEYDHIWDGLQKTLVCKGEGVRSIVNVGIQSTVAHEVLRFGRNLYLGVEGCSQDGTLVIPTVWANCGPILPSAQADCDSTSDPTPSVWNQILSMMGDPANLNTEEKANLVAAINEVLANKSLTDYSRLTNKPRINGVELTGNQTFADLKIPTVTNPQTDSHFFDPYLRVAYTENSLNNDGTVSTQNPEMLTEYLPVISGETIWLNGNLTHKVAFYDAEKNFLSILTVADNLNSYIVPDGAAYARFQNTANGGAVCMFPIRKKETPVNKSFADIILSPLKSDVIVGFVGDDNTMGEGLHVDEDSWANLMAYELYQNKSVRILPISRFAEVLGTFSTDNIALTYRAGSQFTFWTDSSFVELTCRSNQNAVFSWYQDDVEIPDSRCMTQMRFDYKFHKITVKFTAGEMTDVSFISNKLVISQNHSISTCTAETIQIPMDYDWIVLMVGTNDRKVLNLPFLTMQVGTYAGRGTFVVPFPNHKIDPSYEIAQYYRYGEYREYMRDLGFEIIDCSDVNSFAFYDDSLYQSNKIYFNAKGHRIMCNMIAGKMGLPIMLSSV